jgi:hypothetical protein
MYSSFAPLAKQYSFNSIAYTFKQSDKIRRRSSKVRLYFEASTRKSFYIK